jgi:hypothetical protein
MIGVRGKELAPQTVHQYKWDAKNPEKVKAYRAEWRRLNARRRLDVSLRYNHGITLEDYEHMLAAQNGCCAICKKLPRVGRRLAVDHDHRTGRVRKLLCNICNRYIGYVNEDLRVFEEAKSYLRDHSN